MQAFAPVAPPYRPGDVVGGRYEIRSLLDQGGSSEVYLATDRVLRRAVVIKAPRAGLLRDPRALARFRHEALGLARLSHPSLVTIHDVGLDPHGPYLVEEFVPGRSLAELLRDRGSLAPATAADIGAATADALAAVHDAGLLHRDLKPGNLMLTPTGGVKLLDLGIAWAADWTSLSGVDEILGTAAYVSPEQVSGGHLDARSDIYSLGVVLYEMLAGHPPFSGTTLELLDHHARRPPRPLRSIRADVPPELARVVERCLASLAERTLRGTARRLGVPAAHGGPCRARRGRCAARATGQAGCRSDGHHARWGAQRPRPGASRREESGFPPPPSGIGAHGACDGFLKYRVTVTWQPAAAAADGYVVFRRALPRGSWTRAALITDPRATSFVDRGLGADTVYGYEVRATAGDRMSKPSHAVTGGTPTFCFG